jgi:hypothetical protein
MDPERAIETFQPWTEKMRGGLTTVFGMPNARMLIIHTCEGPALHCHNVFVMEALVSSGVKNPGCMFTESWTQKDSHLLFIESDVKSNERDPLALASILEGLFEPGEMETIDMEVYEQ